MMKDKYILVTGCFDIVHVGHAYLFDFINSKFAGHKLIVAMDTDRRVKEMKGETRPINNQHDRMAVIRSFKGVEKVILFDTNQELEKICEQLRPIRVVGSDYMKKPIVGKQYCSSILFFDRITKYSSTITIEKINEKSNIDS